MSVHPRSDNEEPSDSKRPRLDSETSCSAISLHPHLFTSRTGLFSVLAPTLGKKPAEEPQVGITEFIDSTSQSFSGIIKHRFTDFLVYEIGQDGETVRLRDIKGPPSAAQEKREKRKQRTATTEGQEKTGEKGDETTTQAAATPVEPTPELPLWNDSVSTLFSPLLTPEKLSEFSQFVLSGSPHTNNTTKLSTTTSSQVPTTTTPFITCPIEDKRLRGKFHQSIRSSFNGKLLSAHKELPETGDVVIEVNWAKGNTNGKRGGGGGGKRDRGDEQELREARAQLNEKLATVPPYIHFTLLKTNKESHDALSTLSQYFNVGTKELGLAGTKDKRAITVQRVSLKRGRGVTVEDVWKVARNGAGGGGRGGRGGARGGRGGARGGGGGGGFVDRNIRIGDVEYGEFGFELGMLKGNKFVVTLRDIDPNSIETIHTSLKSLGANGFLNYYGMQRFGTAPIPTHLIGLALLRSEWEFAVDLIMSEREGEQQDISVARGLWREGKRDEARKIMPRRCTAERSVMEQYKRGNEKDHLGALSAIPKNLRLMYVHAWQSYIWNRLVSERVKLYGATEPVEGDLVYVGEGEEVKEDVQVEGGGDEPEASTTDRSSAESQQAYYASTSSLAKVRALTKSDLESKKYTIYDVVLPMPGFAVTYPGGELGEVYKRVIKEDGIDPEKMWRKQKEYSLGGTYRKIVHLPSAVSYKLLVSTSSQQDLAQSDEDVLLGKPPLEVKEYDEKVGLGEGESLALQVELELGSSTYATMALREILKSRTSAANQKSLTKEMEGRLNESADQAPSAEDMVTGEESKETEKMEVEAVITEA